jgi:hypothetical protein
MFLLDQLIDGWVSIGHENIILGLARRLVHLLRFHTWNPKLILP